MGLLIYLIEYPGHVENLYNNLPPMSQNNRQSSVEDSNEIFFNMFF